MEMDARSLQTAHGIPASPGFAVGPVFLYESDKLVVSKRHESDSTPSAPASGRLLSKRKPSCRRCSSGQRHAQERKRRPSSRRTA